MVEIALVSVGVVRSDRKVVLDDDWDSVSALVELEESRFSPDALAGLDTFSHVEVVFLMDRVAPVRIEHGTRHPRNNPAWPRVGIFAQRAKNRPNRIGTTICRIQRIEGLKIYVTGLDAVDGSPVLDLKPWVRELGPRGDVRQPAWVSELMEKYW
jgi:tRNA-Thr(GGU) m(6)t(6)A37 methyltransferase TsaA